MEAKKKATEAAPSVDGVTKIRQEKDINKVLNFFRYKPATTLECMIATGVLRNSITWYVCQLEDMNLLQSVGKDKDPFTGFTANLYSSDPTRWVKKNEEAQLSLTFGEEGGTAWE